MAQAHLTPSSQPPFPGPVPKAAFPMEEGPSGTSLGWAPVRVEAGVWPRQKLCGDGAEGCAYAQLWGGGGMAWAELPGSRGCPEVGSTSDLSQGVSCGSGQRPGGYKTK